MGNRVDGSAIVSASGVSRSSAGRRGENGIRERRSTNASGNRSTAGNSSNSNPPGSPSSSSRTRNPKPLKVTQELKDREREAQNSMLGKWRLRRRRRAAVGAAALAAEEEEDMKTRIQANLRARDGDDEMLVDAGSNVNGSGSGLEEEDRMKVPDLQVQDPREERIELSMLQDGLEFLLSATPVEELLGDQLPLQQESMLQNLYQLNLNLTLQDQTKPRLLIL